MDLKWISEEEGLPPVAQRVLLLSPRQMGEWWDPRIAMILVRYEEVVPHPVRKGDLWPTNFYWNYGGQQQTCLVTGNAYWASLEHINLPPGAEHYSDKRSRAIKQVAGLTYAVPNRSDNSREEQKP